MSYLAGEFSFRVAAEEHGLPNKDTAKECVRWYRVQLRTRTIHHSDRGCQYCSGDYVRRLRRGGFQISTTQNGSPFENALAESVNGQLEVEYSLDRRFATEPGARAAAERAIAMYNDHRPHGALQYRKPRQVHYGRLELA